MGLLKVILSKDILNFQLSVVVGDTRSFEFTHFFMEENNNSGPVKR